MTIPEDGTPIACALGGDAARAREARWRAVAGAALRTGAPTQDGVRLEFEPDPAAAHALLDLVAGERECCAWASWTLVSAAGATVVEVAAPGAGAAALREMFGVGT